MGKKKDTIYKLKSISETILFPYLYCFNISIILIHRNFKIRFLKKVKKERIIHPSAICARKFQFGNARAAKNEK